MSIMDFVTIVSFGIACFSLGYAISKDINAKK